MYLGIFYKEVKNTDIFKNLTIIKDIKKSKVEQIIDSINSETYISKSLGNLSNKQFKKLLKDSLILQIVDNSALNYILLSKLKENSNLREKYLNNELIKFAKGDLISYIKYQVGELSIYQFKLLNNNQLDTLIIKDNLVLNSLLLSKMKEKSNLRKEYLNSKLVEITEGNLDEYIKLQVGTLSKRQFRLLKNKNLDTLILPDSSLNALLILKMENNLNLRQVYKKEQILAKKKLLEQQILERKKLAEQQEYARIEARKKNIRMQFSAWDGSHNLLDKYLDENIRDYKHLSTNYSDHGKYILVKTEFEGKNAFGMSVRNVAECRAKIDGSQIYNIRIY